jgi:hypothetical protein
MGTIVQQLWFAKQHLLFARRHNICETEHMAEEDEVRLGGRVGRILAERKLQQDWLVQKVDGLTQQNLSNLITRNSKTSEFALRIADALNVSPRWLLDGVGTPTGSGREPASQTDTVNAPMRLAVISANLDEPEAELIVRLIVASDCPGISVEGSEEWITSKVRGRRAGDRPAQMPRQERPKALEATKGRARKGHK